MLKVLLFIFFLLQQIQASSITFDLPPDSDDELTSSSRETISFDLPAPDSDDDFLSSTKNTVSVGSKPLILENASDNDGAEDEVIKPGKGSSKRRNVIESDDESTNPKRVKEQSDDNSYEDTTYLTSYYYRDLCTLIKQKKSLDEIYTLCTRHGAAWPTTMLNEQEKKSRLNRVFAKAYKEELLMPQDTIYLKSPNAVIDRNGETKEKIFNFLKERSRSGVPTDTLNTLYNEFNKSRFKTSRPLFRTTISGHIETLKEEQRITPAIASFLELCKDADQSRRARQQKPKS